MLESCLGLLGIMFESFWNHWGLCWDYVLVILETFWDYFAIILGSFRGNLGITLGSCWGHFGMSLESFGVYFVLP